MSDEVVQEGLQWILEVCFSEEQSVPASFYLALVTDASVAEDATWGDLTEVSGTDYARESVLSDASADGWTSATTPTNDWKTTSKTVTFGAAGAGGWSGAIHVCLLTTVDEYAVLIAAAALSTTRTLAENDTLDIAIALTAAG